MSHGVSVVGYQGVPGAFSETAASRLDPAAALVPCRTFAEVFTKVTAGAVDAGVLPAENSLTGSIGEVYDLLLEYSLTITGETVVPVEQCLLALPGAAIGDIRRVISHPQALAQCSTYIERMSFDAVPFYDTAGAAKHIAEQRLSDTAAIASARAAEIYGLEVLERAIQKRPDNFTRFFRIEKLPRPAGLRNKSVFAISLENVPGSLFHGLASFACRGVNLTRIESRPIAMRPWRYVFFLEFEGHVNDWKIKCALDELNAKASMVRALGSFAVDEVEG